jgi:quercetin dioxygenase-like cupin family protein
MGPSQELFFVASGRGVLRLDGEKHGLEPDTAALLLPQDAYELEVAEELTIVSVLAPSARQRERHQVTIRLADCEEHRADEHRTFRLLFQTNVTQFVGFVEPSRAPDHSHPYDEVGYVLEGSGFFHVDGGSSPIGPGSRFHLPPGKVHCIENAGPGVMRILGVFYPSGSPAQRS